MNPLVSVVIPARNEFPNLVHTLYSIWHSWESGGGKPSEIEIIIVDNGSNDDEYDRRATKGTTSYLEGRGAYWARSIKILRDPICGNHSARNKGAKMASGKYVFFSDAHMAYKPGVFHLLMQAVDESGGIVHCPISWMGAYPSWQNNGSPHGIGFQYTIKIGDEFRGTWNPSCLDYDKWWYIPALGHCSLMVNREQFLKFGGYPKVHRTYGGGEVYVNFKWWMMGSSVAVHPRAVGYHLASGRGYSYLHDDYKQNVLGVTWALGADEWQERTFLNWSLKGKESVMKELNERAKREHQPDREWVAKNRKMTFNRMIIERPWDKLNDKRFGKHNGALSIFHDTWIENHLRKGPKWVQDWYDNSPLQKSLNEFIEANLSDYVYKRR